MESIFHLEDKLPITKNYAPIYYLFVVRLPITVIYNITLFPMTFCLQCICISNSIKNMSSNLDHAAYELNMLGFITGYIKT